MSQRGTDVVLTNPLALGSFVTGRDQGASDERNLADDLIAVTALQDLEDMMERTAKRPVLRS
jgi:hypothetical protein